jgi:hypothetical protein
MSLETELSAYFPRLVDDFDTVICAIESSLQALRSELTHRYGKPVINAICDCSDSHESLEITEDLLSKQNRGDYSKTYVEANELRQVIPSYQSCYVASSLPRSFDSVESSSSSTRKMVCVNRGCISFPDRSDDSINKLPRPKCKTFAVTCIRSNPQVFLLYIFPRNQLLRCAEKNP